MKIEPLFLLWHLSLSEALICNGLVRVLADRHAKIIIPCLPRNLQAVKFMFSDDPRIEVVEVQNATHAAALALSYGSHLPLGYFSKETFDPNRFDQDFYSVANVEFSDRWDRFSIPKIFTPEAWGTLAPHAFVHQDSRRGHLIQLERIAGAPIFATPSKPFFDWAEEIFGSMEIHCINSAFLVLIDSLPCFSGESLFFHRYAKPTPPPILKRKWVVLEKI